MARRKKEDKNDAATPAETTTAPVPPAGDPGEAPEAGRRKRTPKETYPGLIDGEGVDVKLKAVPGDWDAKKHAPFKKGDFEDEAVFLDWKADVFQGRADRYRNEAERYRKLGGVQDRAKAKRLLNMQSKMTDLIADLRSQGVNVDELLAAQNGDGGDGGDGGE
jgi:hypothetical protein